MTPFKNIPSHWQTKRLKYLSSHVARGDSPKYVEKSSIAVVNQACIQWSGLRLENVKYQDDSEPYESSSFLREGDIVINSTGTGTLGRVALFDVEGVFLADGHVTIVRTLPDVLEPLFLRHILATEAAQNYIYTYCVAGSTNQIELSREALRSLPIPVPPLDEQRAIAKYLDAELGQIDTLREEKERFLKLLDEKRGAMIARAVTRGLI